MENKENELDIIKLYDSVKSDLVINWWYYRDFIGKKVKEIKVSTTDNEFKLENIYNDRVLCSIIIERENLIDMKPAYLYRTFKVQTLTKKGTLSSPELVSIYNECDANKLDCNIPKKANEQQLKAFLSTMKKMEMYLMPVAELEYPISKPKEDKYASSTNKYERNRKRRDNKYGNNKKYNN